MRHSLGRTGTADRARILIAESIALCVKRHELSRFLSLDLFTEYWSLTASHFRRRYASCTLVASTH